MHKNKYEEEIYKVELQVLLSEISKLKHDRFSLVSSRVRRPETSLFIGFSADSTVQFIK